MRDFLTRPARIVLGAPAEEMDWASECHQQFFSIPQNPSRPVIPDEAVEAATDQLPYQAADYVDTDTMRAALEAAAPYMMAAAFEQGQKSGMRHADRLVAAAKIGKPELPGPISTNPYRPTK